MAEIEKIKKLREKTGISVMECKKAIEEAGGDLSQAEKILRKAKRRLAAKKKGRTTGEGVIASYIHANKKMGSLVQVNCETDFVSKSKRFQKLAEALAMQVAAMNPLFVSEEDIPEEVLQEKKETIKEKMKEKEKPADIINKIAEGKISKWKNQVCLLRQEFIKDSDKSVKDLVQSAIAEIGENITIERFTRYEI